MFTPEMTVTDAAIMLAHRITMREPGVDNLFGHEAMQWRPVELPQDEAITIFAAPIAIPRIGLVKNRVTDIQFDLGGDEITVIFPSDITLAEDTLAHHILNEFTDIYQSHSHALCFRALRLERMKRQRVMKKSSEDRERRLQSNIDEMYANGKIRIIK